MMQGGGEHVCCERAVTPQHSIPPEHQVDQTMPLHHPAADWSADFQGWPLVCTSFPAEGLARDIELKGDHRGREHTTQDDAGI